jgi:hypothetical protein
MTLSSPSVEIHVDDIMGAAVSKEWILKLLTAIMESIFIVCSQPQMDVQQCPLSLEKWSKFIIEPRHIILGLVVDTNGMMVKISDEYLDEVRLLITTKMKSKKEILPRQQNAKASW